MSERVAFSGIFDNHSPVIKDLKGKTAQQLLRQSLTSSKVKAESSSATSRMGLEGDSNNMSSGTESVGLAALGAPNENDSDIAFREGGVDDESIPIDPRLLAWDKARADSTGKFGFMTEPRTQHMAMAQGADPTAGYKVASPISEKQIYPTGNFGFMADLPTQYNTTTQGTDSTAGYKAASPTSDQQTDSTVDYVMGPPKPPASKKRKSTRATADNASTENAPTQKRCRRTKAPTTEEWSWNGYQDTLERFGPQGVAPRPCVCALQEFCWSCREQYKAQNLVPSRFWGR